jgi:rod shape determining protein RodA
MSFLGSTVGRVDARRMPWLLLLGAMALTAVGVAFIWSSHPGAEARKQLVFAAIGLAAFAAMALVDYRHLAGAAIPLYVLGLLGLLGLPLFGVTVNNARRWYDLGLASVQPSEPMKYILALVLADHFRSPERRGRLRDLLPPLALTALPMCLIAAEPDVGTAMLFIPLFFSVAFLGGVRVRNLTILAAAGVVFMVAAWFTPGVLKGYQKDRVISFIDPASNPDSSASYNARQALMAASSGGTSGHGWGMGVLNRLGRIPERHTDFIFPVIAEEWGFVRTAPFIALYVLMVVMLARTARKAREPFGRLLAAGVVTIFGFQSVLNMAIALGLAPITGLTLPLVSYGGSSLVSTYAGLGMAASTSLHGSDIMLDDHQTGR